MINNKIYIIAEIGVNHNGSRSLAKELIRECKKSGADAVKFQTYSSDSVCASDTDKAPYQDKTQGNQSQLNMLRKYELKHSDFIKLKKYSESKEIDFITTITDKEDIHFITKELNLKLIKVGSSDLTNIQLLLHLGRTNKSILLSTGMSDLHDIDIALSALAYGNKNKNFNFKKSIHANYFKKNLKYINNKVILFHCTTEYPAPMNELNLNVLDTLNKNYNMRLGYSDHSTDFVTPVLASSKKIKFIEVHVTKSNKLSGPDHESSLNINDFKKYVQLIRKSEIALGSSTKKITFSERKNYRHVIKRLFLRKDISSGQILKDEHIACKRSASGICAKNYSDVLNKKVKKDLKKDSKLYLRDLI